MGGRPRAGVRESWRGVRGRERCGSPQLDELVGAYPNYNEEEEERRYYRRKRLGVLRNVLAASAGGTLTYGVYLGAWGARGRGTGVHAPLGAWTQSGRSSGARSPLGSTWVQVCRWGGWGPRPLTAPTCVWGALDSPWPP